jgi:DNA-binding XRE family transcriptional regulator
MNRDERPAHCKKRQQRQARKVVNAVRSLDEVADILGLSRQRVHEIESRAFKKLRHAFLESDPSLELQLDKDGLVCGLREVEQDPHAKGDGTNG